MRHSINDKKIEFYLSNFETFYNEAIALREEPSKIREKKFEILINI